jgi:hypothetical protein
MPKRKYVAGIQNLGKWAMQSWERSSNKENVRQSKVKIHLIHDLTRNLQLLLPLGHHQPVQRRRKPK